MQYVCTYIYISTMGRTRQSNFRGILHRILCFIRRRLLCRVVINQVLSLNSSQCKSQLLRAWLSSTAQSQGDDGRPCGDACMTTGPRGYIIQDNILPNIDIDLEQSPIGRAAFTDDDDFVPQQRFSSSLLGDFVHSTPYLLVIYIHMRLHMAVLIYLKVCTCIYNANQLAGVIE